MDLIQGLLGLDNSNFNTDTKKEIEIKRLSKLLGYPFNVTIKSLSPDRIYELQDRSLDNNGLVSMNRFYKGACNICSEAIVEPNFDDMKLKKKLNLNERCLKIDVIKKVLKVNEINMINGEVMTISGFDDQNEIINEVKKD